MFSRSDEKYRLSPADLTALAHKIVDKYEAPLSSQNLDVFRIVKSQNKKFVICPMSKDSATETNEFLL